LISPADAVAEGVVELVEPAELVAVAAGDDESEPVLLPDNDELPVSVKLDVGVPVWLPVLVELDEPVSVKLDDGVPVWLPVAVDVAAGELDAAAEPGDGGRKGRAYTAPAPEERPLAPSARTAPSPLSTTGRPNQSLSAASAAPVCVLSAHGAETAAVCSRVSVYTRPRELLR
jgi:hypothetical protein